MRNGWLRLCLMAVVFILMGAGSLWAWESDRIFDLNGFFIPETKFEKEDGKMDISSVEASSLMPFRASESIIGLVGFAYQGLFVQYDDLDFAYVGPDGKVFTEKDLPDNLHAVDLRLGCVVALDEEFSLIAEFNPGIHSDMEDISSKDVYYQEVILVSYVFSESLTGMLGVGYMDTFGEPEFLPFAGVQWQISEDFILDTLLPVYFVAAYQPETWIKMVGLRGRMSGHQFRLQEDEPWEDTVLKYRQLLVGPFVDIALGGNWVLRLEGGVAAAREFEFRDDDSTNKLYDGDLDDAGYVSASVYLGI